jgi:hypothetical protein
VDCNNPLLQFAHQVAGILTDVAELHFTVKEAGGTVRVSETVVDLTACSSGGQKLGTGRYTPIFTPSTGGGWSATTHEIVWRFKPTATSSDQFATQRFEVLPVGLVSSGAAYRAYADASVLAANSAFAGFTVADIQRELLITAETIETLTGRFFEPRFMDVRFNGTSAGALPLGDPIIGIETVSILAGGPAETILDLDINALVIYNRHLTNNLINPDDRDNPRIEFVTDLLPGETLIQGRFQLGRQNIRVVGTFGYTDFDGGPMGSRPRNLERAAAILTLRRLSDPFGVDVFSSTPGRIKKAKTRDQSIEFHGEQAGGIGALTGDRAVDDLLIPYIRPPHYGAVASVGRTRTIREGTSS